MSACNRQEETKGKDNECDPAPYNGLVCVCHTLSPRVLVFPGVGLALYSFSSIKQGVPEIHTGLAPTTTPVWYLSSGLGRQSVYLLIWERFLTLSATGAPVCTYNKTLSLCISYAIDRRHPVAAFAFVLMSHVPLLCPWASSFHLGLAKRVMNFC